MRTILFLGALIATCPLPCRADVRCAGKVSYSWKPADKDAALETSWKLLESRAPAEEGAKQQFTELKARAEVSAMEDCRARHERPADCLANSLNAHAQQLTTLHFAARKELQEAIKKECESLTGICQSAKTEEPICVTTTVEGQGAQGTPGADQGADADKKKAEGDKKKEEEKKKK